MTTVTWEKFKTSARITIPSTEDVILSKGDCITFNYLGGITRPDDDWCVVTGFTGYEEDSGPIGFTYLPWRHTENRWASESFSLKGNARHVICSPCGITHSGQNMDWTTLRRVNELDHPEFQTKIKTLKSVN
jgi:hypothetical protein